MMKKSEIEKEMKDAWMRVVQRMGLDNLTNTIITTLYFEPEPISMAELAKKTGYSLASVSLKLKTLMSTNFWGIQQTKKPGSRKTLLSMEKDMLKIWTQHLKTTNDMVNNVINANVPPVIDKCKNKKLNAREKEQLKILENYYKRVQQIEEIMQLMAEKAHELNKTK